MQDVFEPMANFGGEVFEPISNFNGKPSGGAKPSGGGNSSGKADMIMAGVGAGLDFGKSLIDARAKKKEAEARVKELRGAKGAELDACQNNKAFKTFLNRKERNKKILDCQTKVEAKFDKQEAEQKEIIKEQIELEKSKVSLQQSAQDDSKKSKESESKKKRNLIIGLSIGGGVLVLGTILFFVLRKK